MSDSFATPMDCSPPGYSIQHGLKGHQWSELSFLLPKGSSLTQDWTSSPCMAGRVLFTTGPSTREAQPVRAKNFIKPIFHCSRPMIFSSHWDDLYVQVNLSKDIVGVSWNSFSDPLTWDSNEGLPSCNELSLSSLSQWHQHHFFLGIWWAIFKWLTPVVTICVVKAQMLWHQNKNGCWETEQRCRVHAHLCQYRIRACQPQILERHVGETKEIYRY